MFCFYDVGAGRITNGVDIREPTQASLRAHIGIVPQDTVLFNDSYLLQYCVWTPRRPPRTGDRSGARRAYSRFVSQLPDGYDTVVGERGLKLSWRRKAAGGDCPHPC